MSRTTKLDDLVEKRICDALKAGHSYAAAARAGGIGPATFHEWLARGRGTDPDRDDPEGRYAAFAERVERAECEAEDRAVRILTSKFDSVDDRIALAAAQWWLERRRPADWGKPKDDAQLPSDEECMAMVRKVREAKTG